VRRLLIVVVIAIVFLFGLATTVILSLRSPAVKVPEVVGKDRFEAESALRSAGLNFRVRATRPSGQTKPDTVLFQLPHAGEEVKEGQTVAVDVSRAAKEGEASETVASDGQSTKDNGNQNTNESLSANNANENKPTRNKNTNNANGNANNSNRDANANRPAANRNANTNRNANAGKNTNGQTGNTDPDRSNRNANRVEPASAPTPGGPNANKTPPPGV
jgi:hypothetical protein